jgi:hypothetical protein
MSIIGGAIFYQYFKLESPVSPPVIEIIPASYDFGDIPYKKVETTFKIKNLGGENLEILGVSTSCGCTKAYAKENIIPPGGETELIVTFDPNLMDYKVVGKVFRAVFVSSNDPLNEEVRIDITANVVEG